MPLWKNVHQCGKDVSESHVAFAECKIEACKSKVFARRFIIFKTVPKRISFFSPNANNLLTTQLNV
jgi:hypothetical protein